MNEGVLFFTGLISLVYVICFFFLCDNVSKIKKKMFEKDNYYYLFNEYKKHVSFGNDEKAKTALQDLVWFGILRKPTLKNYEEIKTKYRSKFDDFGMKFPDYPF